MKGEIQLNVNNMKQVKGRLSRLNEEISHRRNNKTLAEMMSIYNKLEAEVSERHKKGMDK